MRHDAKQGSKKPEWKNKINLYEGQLGRTLFFWFLTLSIVPLTVVSIISYQNAYKSLYTQTIQKLEVTAKLKADIINSYFESVITDLHILSDNNANEQFLLELKKAYHESNKSLDKFVKSYQWAKMTRSSGRAGDLEKFREDYQFYDIWLVDNEFNVLFTVTRENELGTNLKTGKHKDELFARKAPEAIDSGKPLYTDIDFHEHATEFTSFLIQSILDETGEAVGLVYIQVEPSNLNLIMRDKTGLGSTGEIYLVGPDFLMRTDPEPDSNDSILNKSAKVETDIVREWHQSYIIGNTANEHKSKHIKEETEIYMGRKGVPVLGHIHNIVIAGTPMALVVEIEAAEAFKPVQTLKIIAVTMVVLTSIIVLYIAFVITRRIVNPVTTLVKATKKLEQGRLKEDVLVIMDDEIGALTRSFNQMRHTMQEKEDSLRQSKDVLEKQAGLKTDIADLNDRLRGELSPGELGNNILSYLVKHMGAQIGAMYLAENGNILKIVSGYAYTKRTDLPSEFRFGEGIVGQAALEKRSIIIKNAPDDYIKVTSGLGKAAPRNILLIPILFENNVIGVLELGSFNEFNDYQTDFIDLVIENIGISLNTANARLRLKDLLEKTQAQAEEMQVQQVELHDSNQRLQQQQEELHVSNEQLQVQEEELRVSNEELTDKSNMLEQQKNDVEKSNKALENIRENLLKNAKALELTSKYKSEFLANMSHELRTPLNSLLLISKKLSKNKDGNLTERQTNAAGIIYNSGNQLLALINEILDLAKIESEKIDINVESVNLADFKLSVENLFIHTIEEKGLTLGVDLDPQLPKTIRTDQQRIDQILRNLMSNAVKFTESGGVTMTIKRPDSSADLSRSGLSPEKTVAFVVEDTGIGIPEDKHLLIFEAFQQADGSTSRRFGGTGLGLSITRELAKLLGGEIQLKSKAGVGSTFTLFVPDAHTASEGMAKTEDVPVAKKVVLTGQQRSHKCISDDSGDLIDNDKVILVIEDDLAFASILKETCHEKGFKCLHAASGEMGLQMADKYMPCAIVLDIKLPGIQGPQVLDMLKDNVNTRHIPVHIVSVTEKSINAFQHGAIGYLTKPVTAEQMDQMFAGIDTVISKEIKDLLVVEDDDELRKSIEELLESDAIRITAVGSGGEAQKLLEKSTYDCMILDLQLPDMSGFDILRAMAGTKDRPTPPVIIYTGKELTKEEQLELNKYADSVVLKGVRSDERLVDETTLFLHTVVEKMGQKIKSKLGEIYDNDSFMQNKKVMVVDDDVRNVFALTDELEELNMIVVKATNGQEALDVLDENPDTDIVLMDIMMPVMDGYEATRRIRQDDRFRDLPVLALTAKAMRGDRDKCIKAGANDYLPKPIDFDRLISTMRVWLKK